MVDHNSKWDPSQKYKELAALRLPICVIDRRAAVGTPVSQMHYSGQLKKKIKIQLAVPEANGITHLEDDILPLAIRDFAYCHE